MTSFKQLTKDGTIKRADAMKVRIEDIHEEPGFNLRRDGEDLEASIDALAAHIADGGIVPPLEVRPREEGGVWIVDGHRRVRAFSKVGDQLRDPDGNLWVNVVAFNGNDADRTLRVITSAEGRALSSLEVADGYKRLRGFGWTPEQIARKVGKTRQHVDQLLILADANTDVQAMVADGTVAATMAVNVVRKHGDSAGGVLAGEVEKAKAAGKAKVTAKTMAGFVLPRGLMNELDAATAALVKCLPKETHEALATLTLSGEMPLVQVHADLLLEIVEVRQAIAEAQAAHDKKQREAQAEAAQADIEDGVAA